MKKLVVAIAVAVAGLIIPAAAPAVSDLAASLHSSKSIVVLADESHPTGGDSGWGG